MTLFRLNLRPGESIFDQLVFAVKKAIVSGELQKSQSFPSVRFIAAEFKIHPNTAHKVVQYLIQERWLEVCPGIGTIVAEIPEPRPGDRKRLLGRELEQLVVEARRLELEMGDVIEALEHQWAKLEMPQEASRK
ncbi:MAG TPA: GntR family transcriptional regulator [Candidatus Acidoferrum sp.]|nr:GntR family transcriptional regulator [Candidatus Acidoferrum sp.]